ncbi:MAG: AMP-binding protein [Bacteroidetes bacterium]|nr:AMP-binding protein [Bacteroidota bacterium]
MTENQPPQGPENRLPCPIGLGARQFPDSPALWHSDRVWTYQDLEEMVQLEAHRLRAHAGRTVALVEWNSPALVASLFALWRIECLVLLLSPRLPQEMVEQAIESIGAQRLSLGGEEAERDLGRSTPSNPGSKIGDTFRPTSRATAMLTSGSTGAPQTIVHSIENHYFSATQCLERLNLGAGSVWLLSLPCFHVGGLAILWRCFISGATVRIQALQTSLSDQLISDPPTVVSLVPTQLGDLITTTGPCPEQISDVIVGGAPISRQLLDAALKLGYPIRTTYGATETASMVTLSERWKRSADVVHAGKPLPGHALTIGTDGRLRIESKALYVGEFRGGMYEERLEATFDSQDRATFLPTGEIQILSRVDDVIITGGENVSLVAIEGAIMSHPDVLACRVVAVEHARYGMQPVAFIEVRVPKREPKRVPKPEPQSRSFQHLQEHLLARLPSFAIPKIMLPMPVPKAGALKITHKQLLEIATQELKRP